MPTKSAEICKFAYYKSAYRIMEEKIFDIVCIKPTEGLWIQTIKKETFYIYRYFNDRECLLSTTKSSDEKEIHKPIYQITLLLKSPVYSRYSWEDVFSKRCEASCVGKLKKSQTGDFLVFEASELVTIYSDSDENWQIDQRFNKLYRDVNLGSQENMFEHDGWVEILDSQVKAPKTGNYLLAIRDDNHIFYNLIHFNKYDYFWGNFLSENQRIEDITQDNLFDWFIPLAYHFVPEYIDNSIFWKNEIKDYSYHIQATEYGGNIFYALTQFDIFKGTIVIPELSIIKNEEDFFENNKTKGYYLFQRYSETFHALHNQKVDEFFEKL